MKDLKTNAGKFSLLTLTVLGIVTSLLTLLVDNSKAQESNPPLENMAGERAKCRKDPGPWPFGGEVHYGTFCIIYQPASQCVPDCL